MKHTPINNISAFTIFRITPNAIFNLLKTIALLFKEIRRRLYSDTTFYIIRRDLKIHADMFMPKIKLKLRELRKDDVPKLINIYKKRLTSQEILERIRIFRMINSGIQTPYVVVTDDDSPCHLAWLIDSRENEKLKSFFYGAIAPLADNQVLFEFVYTVEKYRGFNIQVWRSQKFVKKSVAMGARWAIGYIRSTNEISLKNARKNAFEPYMIRTDQWRFFRFKMNFESLFPDSPDSNDVK